MTITLNSHQQVTKVEANHSSGIHWVEAVMGGTPIVLFVSKENLEGMKTLAFTLLEVCVGIERGELVRVETQAARHAVAKTNPSAAGMANFDDDVPF